MENQYYLLKQGLRDAFMKEVEKEYRRHKMSGNLVKSMRKRTIKRHGIVSVYIYAPRYDIWKWWYDRVIIPTGTGSYAEDNDSGSGGLKPGKNAKSGYVLVDQLRPYARKMKMLPTHHHNDFVSRCANSAITSTMKRYGIKKYIVREKGR